MEKILKELELLKLMLEEMKKQQKFGEAGQRTIHRGGISMAWSETPSGTINGVNTTFTLANTPVTGTLLLYINGMRMKAGGEDYSISGKTITANTAPPTRSILLADYQK